VIQGSGTAGQPGIPGGRTGAGPKGAAQASGDGTGGAGQTGGGTDQTGTDESLADAFLSVSRKLRETSQETLAPWDINPSQFRALRVLNHHGAIRLSDLSGRLHIAPRSATEVVDALESRGLVERRPDPSDRRATLAELTEHGTTVLTGIRAARGTEAERVFDRLSPADRDHLARILRQLQN
jgi:DNA-binding MarR family transcriptional regulator